MNLDVLYNDNHLLAVAKPAMIPTQVGNPRDRSLEELTKIWIQQQTGKIGAIFLQPIHRLDKAVSGIVLFARSSKALSRLNEAMRQKTIHKTYYALVEGTFPMSEGVLEHYLLHGDFRAELVADEKGGGKKAILTYKVLETKKHITLVEIRLVTGRYHQIRAQLAAIGCPIIGDHKYGSQLTFPYPGIALHHGKMTFLHPVSKLPIEILSYSRFDTCI